MHRLKLIVPRIHLTVILSGCVTFTSLAQSSSRDASDSVFNLLETYDSVLFSRMYTCDYYLNLEFYEDSIEAIHDQLGLIVSRDSILALSKKFCDRKNIFRMRRELIRGSLKVYPIANYGAIQSGEHLFYVTRNGEKERLVEKAKFIRIWHYSEYRWRVARIISFDHQPMN